MSPRSIPATPAGASASTDGRYPWSALATAYTGVFMAIMDVFVVLVAAPAIQADLRASDAVVQFVLAGYQVTYAVTLVIGGRLGDRCGRRRIFRIGMVVFTLASAGCGLAPSSGVLIGMRLVQGFGSALMFPQSFSLIQALVPADRRARAFGLLGAVIGSSTIIGQVLGGVLVEADLAGLSWRPVFLINVPIGLVSLWCAGKFVPESRAPRSHRLDLRGAVVLAVALTLLIVPLVQGRQLGWPAWSWLCLVAVVPATAGFVRAQRATVRAGGDPLVDPALLGQRTFAVGVCLVLLSYATQNSSFLVLSLTLQDGMGLGALESGLTYAPVAVCFLSASLLAARIFPRLGTALLPIGAAVTGLGFAAGMVVAAVAGPGLSVWALVPALVLQGAGMGLFQTPLQNTVLAQVSAHHVGTASGVVSTAQQVGGAVGVTIVGMLYFGALRGTGSGGHAHAFATSLTFNVVATGACLALLFVLTSGARRPTG
ncbi:MFS transporter [Saccharopolyspora rosea]|uniref:MFS transporter n=1 Tax=Saccharopolyspora rosea TaxID=524884 RepID=A0ABW3FZQ9_9PSEU|nr:MFS transporter [Saccharopolyspora rosea]